MSEPEQRKLAPSPAGRRAADIAVGAARGAGEASAFSVDPADGSLTAITGASGLATGWAGLVAV